MSTTLSFADELRQKALEMRQRNSRRFTQNNDPIAAKKIAFSSYRQDTNLLVGTRDAKKMSLSLWQILGNRASQGDKAAKQEIEAAKIKARF